MRAKTAFSVFCSVVVVSSIGSCSDEEPVQPVPELHGPVVNLPITPYNYGNFNNALPTLGRVLFYDKALSSDHSVSCASCHKQSLAFSDNRALSAGVKSQHTMRNTLALMNVPPKSSLAIITTVTSASTAYYGPAESVVSKTIGGLFWDGREKTLETMVMLPVANPAEMGNRDASIVATKVLQLPYYTPLLNDAFKYDPQNGADAKVAKALAAFVSAITISHTRFDQYNDRIKSNQNADNILSPLEIRGMQLFQGEYNCNNCHRVEEVITTTPRFANIGLDASYSDNGLSNVTTSSGDEGKFRVPSLRNVELTAPYMHDGRFTTLEQVVQHYSNGILDHPNLHPELRDAQGKARHMNIPESDIQAIVAFLHTLSDESILADPKFSDPFKSN
jgi:cytochrome c peroxidase